MVFDLGNVTNTAGNLKAIALKFQDYVISNATHGDINALEYLADVISLSANVDYARDSASAALMNFTYTDRSNKVQKVNNAWAGGKSYSKLLSDAWDSVCPWRTCSAFVFETFR